MSIISFIKDNNEAEKNREPGDGVLAMTYYGCTSGRLGFGSTWTSGRFPSEIGLVRGSIILLGEMVSVLDTWFMTRY